LFYISFIFLISQNKSIKNRIIKLFFILKIINDLKNISKLLLIIY